MLSVDGHTIIYQIDHKYHIRCLKKWTKKKPEVFVQIFAQRKTTVLFNEILLYCDPWPS